MQNPKEKEIGGRTEVKPEKGDYCQNYTEFVEHNDKFICDNCAIKCPFSKIETRSYLMTELNNIAVGGRFRYNNELYEKTDKGNQTEIPVWNLTRNCSTLLPKYIKVFKEK